MKNFYLLILSVLCFYGSTVSMQYPEQYLSSAQAGQAIFFAIENSDLDWLKDNLTKLNRQYPNVIYQKYISSDRNSITPYAFALFRTTNYFKAMNWYLYNKYLEIAKLLVNEGADLYGDDQADLYLNNHPSIKDAIYGVSRKRSREDGVDREKVADGP